MNFLSIKNRALHVLISTGAFLILTTQEAAAYKVSPLHHYLSLTGKGATSSFVISNTHDYPLTVEMTIERRELSGGIVSQDIPADDDFLIFPPQAIIPSGKKQRVQIRYVGDPVEASELYRLLVTQVPVDLDEGDTTQVNLAYNFVSAVYVAPSGAEADISVNDIKPSSAGGFDVTLTNKGNYHALLPSFKWTGSDGSQNAVLSPADLPLGEEPFIEPGGQRVVTLPRAAIGKLSTLSSLKIAQSKDSKKRSR